MSDQYLGEIRIFAGNFAPLQWAFCQGQLLSISQYAALFSLLGTIYGGNGTTNFALPDLRGRAPIGFGQGLGLSNYAQGAMTGTETVTIFYNQMPIHSHYMNVSSNTADTVSPSSATCFGEPVLSNPPRGTVPGITAFSSSAVNTTISPATITNAGGNQPISVLSPVLALNFIIALSGVYPSRN